MAYNYGSVDKFGNVIDRDTGHYKHVVGDDIALKSNPTKNA
ncbi:hypothetical protein JCM19233_693 [Vibrio astriarenae]|nr:hypothetical protein JCM19233_693 [Vibrio sp. C7]